MPIVTRDSFGRLRWLRLESHEDVSHATGYESRRYASPGWTSQHIEEIRYFVLSFRTLANRTNYVPPLHWAFSNVIPDFDVIGPYKILRVLGKGGMGTVYQGAHAKTNEAVAIKVIAPGLAQHQRFRRRFDSEIQTLIKLKHPNIVQLIGFGEEKGLLFYSMEYVDGENLQQILRREKTLTWERVIDMAIDICSALKHAHDFGIIHRDLKPANIMINPEGKIKLTDFGIAKLFGAMDATVEGAVLGTADFMPPEQAEGKPVSVRSDLYSLGSLCYTSLAGRPPFAGKSIPEILFNVRYGTLVPLATVAPNAPKELCDLIEELMRKEPSLRPPTGLVVGNRFQALRAGLSKRARERPSDQTEVGNLRELTSIDMSDDMSLASDVRKILPGNETIVTQRGRLSPQFNAPDLPNGTMPTSLSFAGPEDKTRIASERSEFEMGEQPSGIDHMSKTNFTEVDDSDRRRSSIVITESDPPSAWTQWIGVGSLVGALLVCLATIFWMSRPPSANALFLQITDAMSSSDDDELVAIEPVATRFKELYSSDARIGDVDALLAEIDSIRYVRQLQRKSKRGGADLLDPIEQAYLECLKAEEIDSQLAQRKLNALVTVFGANEKLTNRQRQFVDLAKRTSQQLVNRSKVSRNPAVEAIQEQMIWADANLSPTARAEWFKSLVELFEEKTWAKEMVALAKSRLATLDKNRSESNDQP
jgi:serine/threonine protein kinase